MLKVCTRQFPRPERVSLTVQAFTPVSIVLISAAFKIQPLNTKLLAIVVVRTGKTPRMVLGADLS
jgi:hypothetical protein